MTTAPYLEDLERRIDPAIEDELADQWRAFWDGRAQTPLFAPRRRQCAPAGVAWPTIGANEAIRAPDAMLLQQLGACSGALAAGNGAPLAIRSNFGTGILPSLFGAETFWMTDASNTLPTTRPLAHPATDVLRLLARGVPDLSGGFGAPVFALAKHYQERLQPYPKLRRYVQIYHPDLQGPMDVCDLLWGSDLFLAVVDTPETVHAFLELIVATYVRFLQQWFVQVPPAANGLHTHWNLVMRGQVMLRDDSAMNFSPEMFERFIAPYDQQVLEAFGGGCIHFCGRGDHYIAHLSRLRGLQGVNLSQPHLNNMETIFRHTVDRGIRLLGLARDAAEQAVAAGRDLHGCVMV